jgi:predicted dehydrogenase
MDRVRIALVGVGGYGHAHISAVQALEQEGLAALVAFAEPDHTVPAVEILRSTGAKYYPDFEDLLQGESDLDLVSICTPIHTHFSIAAAAFARGIHVMLEKPPVVRVQDLRELTRAQDDAGVFCCAGFHDVARPGIIELKRRICEGELGTIRAVRAETRWQRTESYYNRSPWAGKTLLDGHYVLDGPMNNSNAHSLNLAAYLTGAEPHEFARPRWVQGELYRANPIEGEDTCCLRAEMETGSMVTVHLTQCATENHPRSVTVIGEKGTARFEDHVDVSINGTIIAKPPDERPTTTIMRRIVEVIGGSDEPLLMPLAEAEGFVLLSNGAYESASRIVRVPRRDTRIIDTDDGSLTGIVGIEQAILQGSEEGKLFSELNTHWAVETDRFALEGYDRFPQRWRG